MVSGVVALIQSVAPKPLSAAEMRTLITRHAQPFPKQPDQFLGLGILDATAAVTAAKAGEIPAAADFTCSQSTTMMQVTCTDLSTARGSAAIQNRTWNFGEGDSDLVVSQLTNPVHNYDHPGTYNVTLTIRDSTGATSRVSRPFVVVAPEATDLAFDNNLLFAAKKGVIKYFKVDVPAGAKSLRVNLSNRSSLETGTMYVSAGSPTAAKANCTRVFASGSGAQCFMSAPAPGVWYIALSPSTDLNDDVIYAIYTP
jgi:serine protease